MRLKIQPILLRQISLKKYKIHLLGLAMKMPLKAMEYIDKIKARGESVGGIVKLS